MAASLCLLLLSVLFNLFIPALRMWVEGQRRAEAGQQLALAYARLKEDLAQSVPRSLTITEERRLSMVCQQQATEGYHLITDQEVLYGCNDGVLWRATTPDSDLQSLRPWEDPASTSGGPSRPVARGVKEWQVALPQPWQCSVRLELESYGHSVVLLTTVASLYAPTSARRKQDAPEAEASDWQLLYPTQESGESS